MGLHHLEIKLFPLRWDRKFADEGMQELRDVGDFGYIRRQTRDFECILLIMRVLGILRVAGRTGHGDTEIGPRKGDRGFKGVIYLLA
jgi:hypothetical protein